MTRCSPVGWLVGFMAVLLMYLSPGAYAADEPRLLVLGDSLSSAYGIPHERGWVALLQQRLAQAGHGHRVVNASITGDTTGGGRARLPAALARHRPALVLIELGGNDGLRGFRPEQTHDNLLAMVQASQAAGARVLLLGVKLPANYGKVYGERFHRVYAEVSEKTGVALVPWLLAGVAERPEAMLADGIHPGEQAQPRILDNVWSVLAPLLGSGPHG